MKQVAVKPNITQEVGQPVMVDHDQLIDIFSLELPTAFEKRREKKLKELLQFFDRNSLRKAIETMDADEIVKRMNTALRQKGINVKLRKEHIAIIKELLEE